MLKMTPLRQVVPIILWMTLCSRAESVRAQPVVIVTTPPSAFAGLTRADPFSLTLTAAGGTGSYSWSLVGGSLPLGLTLTTGGAISGTPTQGGPFEFSLKAEDDGGLWGVRSYSVAVYPVPKPKPINIPYSLTAIYFPKPSYPSHQWADLRMLNEQNVIKASLGQRMPLLGYYQGDRPEVLDWQIKMAVDRGITNFSFMDHWVENVPGGTYPDSINAFLQARYRSSMSFTMRYSACATLTGSDAARRACFTQKAIPYYVAHYFNQPNYLIIAGRPAVEINHMSSAFGFSSASEIAAALAEADQYIDQNTPYPGAYWIVGNLGSTTVDFSYVASAGFDAVSPYYVLPRVWPTSSNWLGNPCGAPEQSPCSTPWPPGVSYATLLTESLQLHQAAFEQAAATGIKYITSMAPDFDSRWNYWLNVFLYFSGHSHIQYWQLVGTMRWLADTNPGALPVNSLTGKPLVGIGPWNEQAESSTIEPGWSVFQVPENGNENPFFVATAVAKLFGGPEYYDEYLPGDYGRTVLSTNEWTFSPSGGVDKWNTIGTAGLAIGTENNMLATGVGPFVILTAANLETTNLQHIKMRLRVDEGAEHLAVLQLHARSSTFSSTAHHFGAPQESGCAFHVRWDNVPFNSATADVYQDYTFLLEPFSSSGCSNPDVLKYVEFRFLMHPGPSAAMRYSIQRVWVE